MPQNVNSLNSSNVEIQRTAARRSSSTFRGILRRVCPHCREGAIFERGMRVYARCPVCGWQFVREPGFFLGAMYISYALVLPPLVAISLVLYLFVVPDWPIYGVLALTFGAFLPLAPLIVVYSRVLYFYLEHVIEASAPPPSATPPAPTRDDRCNESAKNL